MFCTGMCLDLRSEGYQPSLCPIVSPSPLFVNEYWRDSSARLSCVWSFGLDVWCQTKIYHCSYFALYFELIS